MACALHGIHRMSTSIGGKISTTQQFKKPSGILGRIIGWLMSWQNGLLNRVAISHLAVGPNDTVLEIGFGPGSAIDLLTEQTEAKRICGVDPSAEMLDAATARNTAGIAADRVELHLGNVDKLPFKNHEFTRVFAVSTFHDWKNRPAGLKEIRRVLEDNGQLLLCRRLAPRFRLPLSSPGLTEKELAQDQQLIEACGFKRVEILRQRRIVV
jgi:ubiquinone/menaquinone biosynthesis C-methylase UbiE